jgi:lipopolysaccharide/colanic/teichoic acid biosynthesis glycosyltransferase
MDQTYPLVYDYFSPQSAVKVEENKPLLNLRALKEQNPELFEFIKTNAYLNDVAVTYLFETGSLVNLQHLSEMPRAPKGNQLIVNLKRLNDIRYINKFCEGVNDMLHYEDVFIGSVESSGNRKERLLQKFPFGINWVYYCFDFVFKRIFPKLPLTKKIYFAITGGRNRVLSSMEAFGRLYSCGYKIVDTKVIGNLTWFSAVKIGLPVYNDQATYGALIRLRRVGFQGKEFSVYKLRTMYPFSEYLQAYISEKQGLQEGGKFKNDPRVTTLGKFFRKFWLDEVPMFINYFKGEMKLVGVRPLSKHYLSLYPLEAQIRRKNYKPGLLPPFYADMPKTIEEIVDSEMKYFDHYDKKGFRADFYYFWKILHNIFIKKARSK